MQASPLFSNITTERNTMKLHYDYLIWDFNGTILDDVDACILSANQLLKNHGLSCIESREAYHKLFGFPIIDYYRRLGFDFDTLPYDELAVEWVAYYLENSKSSTLCPNVRKTIAAVHEMGVKQWILSATEREMLCGQVKKLGIYDYFDGILGLDNINAYSKEEVAVRWRATHPDARMLMIGDTDHDAGVARAMGIDCILVTSGHQSRETLEKFSCLLVADSAKEVLRVLS